MEGYSGTPLAKKLGIKDGYSVLLVNAPGHYYSLFNDFPANVSENASCSIPKNFIHFFTKEERELRKVLPRLKKQLQQDGMIWVSWPKKASKVVTDITEDSIRNYALSIGLVDVKVCAIDDVWSGLKLVIPVKDRKK